MSDPEVPQGGGEGPVPGTPPDLPPPGSEDVLGRRIAATLIDLVLLAGLFVILAAAVGQFSVSGGSFSVSLDGAWALVFLVLALGYYFVLEAWAGQTVGKRLLSLRVLHAGGARPSARAVAIRTLLRMVDWLPLLYLAGFITMLATGKHRRRIGDLAARTAVTRAAPVRHRALALVPLAVVVLAAAGLSVYRANSAGGILAYAAYPAGGTQTYRANGVSFEYPAGWREHSIPPASGGGGQRLWSTIVGPGTQMDVIAVEAFGGSLPVATAQDIDTSGLESLVRRLFAQVGGAMQAGPEQITMAGLPGLWFRGTGTSRGSRYESTLVFAFSGTTEYFVNCQHTSAMAAAVERACGLVVASFRVS